MYTMLALANRKYDTKACIPWYSDHQGKLVVELHSKGCKLADRKRHYIDEGVRGMLPLNPGDVMIMTGMAQNRLQHKSLPKMRPT